MHRARKVEESPWNSIKARVSRLLGQVRRRKATKHRYQPPDQAKHSETTNYVYQPPDQAWHGKTTKYIYQPLDDGWQIRVMHLMPRAWSDASEIELQVIDIRDSHQYEAISYCWGDDEGSREVVCSGQPIAVTRNLSQHSSVSGTKPEPSGLTRLASIKPTSKSAHCKFD